MTALEILLIILFGYFLPSFLTWLWFHIKYGRFDPPVKMEFGIEWIVVFYPVVNAIVVLILWIFCFPKQKNKNQF